MSDELSGLPLVRLPAPAQQRCGQHVSDHDRSGSSEALTSVG
jgi:hypothetical protein